MADIVLLGAGVAGHTAALHLKRLVGAERTITVVTPNAEWNWIPSNIWVGVGEMKKSNMVFTLEPVYRRHGIHYVQAKAVALWPYGDEESERPAVGISYSGNRPSAEGKIRYDYLINATGPQLRFAG